MEGCNVHKVNFGGSKMIKDGDKIIKVKYKRIKRKI
jgi:hypothetical protein